MGIEMTTVSLDAKNNEINPETKPMHRMNAIDFISRLLDTKNVVVDPDAPGYLELEEYSNEKLVIWEVQAESVTNPQGLASRYILTAAADRTGKEDMGLLYRTFLALRQARDEHIMTSDNR